MTYCLQLSIPSVLVRGAVDVFLCSSMIGFFLLSCFFSRLLCLPFALPINPVSVADAIFSADAVFAQTVEYCGVGLRGKRRDGIGVSCHGRYVSGFNRLMLPTVEA